MISFREPRASSPDDTHCHPLTYPSVLALDDTQSRPRTDSFVTSVPMQIFKLYVMQAFKPQNPTVPPILYRVSVTHPRAVRFSSTCMMMQGYTTASLRIASLLARQYKSSLRALRLFTRRHSSLSPDNPVRNSI